MKYGILGCVLFLILIGTASATSINPAVVVRTIQPGAVVSVPVINSAPITFDSSVHGATVYLDGNLLGADEAHSKTPVTDNAVTAGNHQATFRLTGYKDNYANFTVVPGKPQTIYAQLQQSLGVAARQNITTLSPRVSLQAEFVTIKPLNITTTKTFTTTPPMINCPAGYTCMSPDQARNTYGAGNYTQYSETLCAIGQTTSGRPVNEYCFAPTVKSVPRVSIASNLVRQPVGGQDTGRGDEGLNPPDGQLPLVVEAPPVQTSTGLIDTIFSSIFGGLFGQKVPNPPVHKNLTMPTIPPGSPFNFDSYTVAPVIKKGATIYIGEEKLNVTQALNQARGTTTDAANNAAPSLTVIGWWVYPAQIYTNSPSKTIDLGVAGRYKSMNINPGDFVGYFGDWYLLGASGYSPYSANSVVFQVRDPQLDLSVKNAATLASIEGTTVTKGTPLRFSITRNIAVKNPYGVANFRSPLTGTRDDGFLDIVVIDPSGNNLTELAVTTDAGVKTTESLRKSCWDSDLIAPNCNPAYTWDTGAVYSNGTARYPSGTYTVQVISKLNNMHNNYKNAGQLYVGKTVSGKVSFILA